MNGRFRIRLLLIHGVLSAVTSSGAVNVLTLGVKNDGSEDVSAIVNAATEKDALFFPAGIYRIAKPIWLKHPICGEGYLRTDRIEPFRTCFVSDIVCTNGHSGGCGDWCVRRRADAWGWRYLGSDMREDRREGTGNDIRAAQRPLFLSSGEGRRKGWCGQGFRAQHRNNRVERPFYDRLYG